MERRLAVQKSKCTLGSQENGVTVVGSPREALRKTNRRASREETSVPLSQNTPKRQGTGSVSPKRRSAKKIGKLRLFIFSHRLSFVKDILDTLLLQVVVV